jgi:nitrous oxide reductase accessory protein NosL
MGRGFWFSAVVVAILSVGLPLLGTRARRQRLPQCALDGVAIVPIYAVEIIPAGQPPRRFCCIRCAVYWLEKESPSSAVVNVTDEVSGKPIDTADAYFVRSSVVTNDVTGNQIHAFADRTDAERHAAQFRGRLLADDARPFR